MKRIVCYGDSNTWGYNPESGERYPENVRWPKVIASILGRDYDVVEEGLNGRTTVFDDPIDDYRNGAKTLMPCLLSHKPIDLVILMLGTNDLKGIFNANPFYITKGLSRLVDIIQRSECGPRGFAPKILVTAPPEIGKNVLETDVSEYFHEYTVSISKMLPEYYAQMAEEFDCDFINAAEFARPSAIDAVHLEEEGHMRLAQAMARKVKEILEQIV